MIVPPPKGQNAQIQKHIKCDIQEENRANLEAIGADSVSSAHVLSETYLRVNCSIVELGIR